MEIKILIADDHSMVREGIKQLLELDPEFKVIGQARDGKECLDLLEDSDSSLLKKLLFLFMKAIPSYNQI